MSELIPPTPLITGAYSIATLCLNGTLPRVDFMDVTMGDIPIYNLTTLCLNGTRPCVGVMDVTMGDIPIYNLTTLYLNGTRPCVDFMDVNMGDISRQPWAYRCKTSRLTGDRPRNTIYIPGKNPGHFANGHFANGHFANGHFANRHFAKMSIMDISATFIFPPLDKVDGVEALLANISQCSVKDATLAVIKYQAFYLMVKEKGWRNVWIPPDRDSHTPPPPDSHLKVGGAAIFPGADCHQPRGGSRIQKGGVSYIQKGGGFVQEFQERIQIVAGSCANQQAKKNCRQP